MRVFISGYYGFGNLGDEMLLDALRALLIEYGFRRDELVVLSASPKETEREHALSSFKRGDLMRLFAEIKRGDLLISGPGGLFQDSTGPWSPAFYASHAFLALLKGAKVLIYGQSLGPIKRRVNLLLVRFLLSKASLVVLRDESMSDMVPRNKLLFTPDPAFILSVGEVSGLRDGIGIVFRRWKWDLESLLRVLVEMGFPLTLISFQAEREREDGIRLSKMYGLPFLTPSNWAEALRVLSTFKLVIGMRLHSLIMSAMTFTPFIGISYDPKVRSLCELLKMPFLESPRETFAFSGYIRDIMIKWDRKSEGLKCEVEILREKVRSVFTRSLNLLLGREA